MSRIEGSTFAFDCLKGQRKEEGEREREEERE